MTVTEPTPEQLFGQHVRAARLERGWTQEALAVAILEAHGIDLPQSGIHRIESGERAARLNEVVAIAQVLRLKISEYQAPEPVLVTLTITDADQHTVNAQRSDPAGIGPHDEVLLLSRAISAAAEARDNPDLMRIAEVVYREVQAIVAAGSDVA